MKQSSIEFAVTSLEKLIPSGNDLVVGAILLQAKEMHKEEIMDAFQEGKWDGWENHKLKVEDKESQWTDPAHYYNETFKTKDK